MLGRADRFCGQIIDSRYYVESRIGHGGMGEVWKVLHVDTRRHYALKTLRATRLREDKTIRRFLQEAKIAAAIDSPNVVRVVDVRPDYVHQGEELPFIVMELANGPNLAQVLEVRERISFAELLWILEEVGQGLSLAHSLGIVHRDLKPSNVVLCKANNGALTAKLCDFGIAKIQRTPPTRDDIVRLVSTETGALFGTPLYMAPEQLVSTGAIVSATDQWAVGVLAFRCIAGRDYFERARNGAEIVLAIVHDALRPPSELSTLFPPAFDDWFLKSCARDSGARFPDVATQVVALKSSLRGVTARPIDLQQVVSPTRDVPTGNERKKPSLARVVLTGTSSSGSWRYTAIAACAAFAVLGTNWLGGHVRARMKSAGAQVSDGTGGVNAGVAEAQQTSESYTRSPDAPRCEASYERIADSTVTAIVGTSVPLTPIRPTTHAKTTQSKVVRRKLPLGAPCTRSAQCSEGFCLAEVCQ